MQISYSRWLLTFSSTIEFDTDLFVHVLVEIKNVFFLWLLLLAALMTGICSTTTTTPIASTSATAATTEIGSLAHLVE